MDTTTKQKQKAIRLLLAGLIVASMFVVRFILLKNDMIRSPEVLEPDVLQERINAYEVRIDTGVSRGGGTILQAGGTRKNRDLIYIVSAAHILKDFQSSDGERPGEVLLPDGTALQGEVIYLDSDRDFGFLRCEGTYDRSVYFSEDLLYQVKEAETVYYESADNGELYAGSFVGRDVEVPSQEGRYMVFLGTAENGMSGSGIYAPTGYFLGTIVAGSEDGNVLGIPGNAIVDAFRRNH